MIVLTAQDVADKGGSLADVKAAAESAARRTKVAFVVDTLEYLEKGGRIGKASAFLGNLLSVKPILTVVDGEVHPMERVRTRTKAIDRLAEYILSFPNPERYAVAHSTTPGDAADLAQRLRSKLPDQEVTISRFGPVLGVYLGPGAIGAAVMQAE
jgi:DegV family protein with EDD domain